MADIFPIRYGDVGVRFDVTITDNYTDLPLDLTTATAAHIYLRKPSGEVLDETATVTDADAGVISYTTVSGDLDELGEWEIQGRVWFGTDTYGTDPVSFAVGPNLQNP